MKWKENLPDALLKLITCTGMANNVDPDQELSELGPHCLPRPVWKFRIISVNAVNEPRHDKTNKVAVRPAKTQISLGICPVWSESSLSAWRMLRSLARLIWVFAGRTVILLVLSWGGSNLNVFLVGLHHSMNVSFLKFSQHLKGRSYMKGWYFYNFSSVKGFDVFIWWEKHRDMSETKK